MNPINDVMPTKQRKNTTNVQKLELINYKKTNKSNEILEQKKKFGENLKITEHQEKENKIYQTLKLIDKSQINMINKLEDKDKKICDSETTIKNDKVDAILNEGSSKREINEKETDENEVVKNIKPIDSVSSGISAGKQQTEVLIEDEEKIVGENHNTIKNKNKNRKKPEATEEIGEYEDVEVPEEVDEIIVPDEAECGNYINKDDISNPSKEKGGAIKDSETEENENETYVHEEESIKSSDDVNNLHIEPELIAIEESIKENYPMADNNDNEEQFYENNPNDAINDPLICIDDHELDEEDNDNTKTVKKKEKKSFGSEDKESVNDDEDDEVQFIETRNSPICIESDDDDDNSKDMTDSYIISNINNNDKQTITTSTATITVPKNIIVTRTSARKSTAKPQQQQQSSPSNKSPTIVQRIQNKSKNYNYLQKSTNYKRTSALSSIQHVVDCIELLDSSEEESAPSSQQQQQQARTPQKRTLLAAKGNYYKTFNKKTNSSNNRIASNFSPQVRQQTKKPAPPPLPPSTPQSNFLNAVQLQPATVSGTNPPAFSALLSNKSVIIPNAFYGNPPSVRGTADTELDRRYIRWLENFLNQFCKPQFVATHSCFVFLQRALKYKDFVRIKTLRTNMNMHTQTARDQINSQLMTDLRTILLKNTKKLTNYGRRFCELVCSSIQGKSVTLMAHGITGEVTLKTCNIDAPRSTTNPSIYSTSSSSHASMNSLTRKRQVEEDEDEYTPDKSKTKAKGKPPPENGEGDSGDTGADRKRSLRTKRTKRLDNSFSYNEDDLLAEYEIDDEEEAEKLAQVEIQRKIEEKRLEAKKQREQQVKSFESAFIQAFARSIDGPTTSSITKIATNQRIRLKNTTAATATSIRQYMANNDAEDLLQATWIENLESDDTQVISDDDEPKEHRIYKQQQQLQLHRHAHKLPKLLKFPKRHQEEIITGDDDYNENNCYSKNLPNVDPNYWPKNVDPQMYVNGKHKDRCIICNLSCQRLVHHYVNEHRGCEVYNSRLSSSQLKLLKQGRCTVSNISLYKNGQFQYEAYCIFCQKQSRFMLPYWYQHFTMHTGEYAYRCTGCGVRKPTRSLLTQHQTQGCPDDGGITQDYIHDSKTTQIEARLCTLCNYIQLHRSNIVKHLHQHHNIKQILPKHIQTIVLLKTTPTSPSSASVSSTGSAQIRQKNATSLNIQECPLNEPNTYVIDDDDNNSVDDVLEEVAIEKPLTNTENRYYNYIPPYMQAAVSSGNFSFEDADAGDDLSFMICGMLDVQMNPEPN